MQHEHRGLQTSSMGLQILCEHLERSGTADQNKIQSKCDIDIPQCDNGL